MDSSDSSDDEQISAPAELATEVEDTSCPLRTANERAEPPPMEPLPIGLSADEPAQLAAQVQGVQQAAGLAVAKAVPATSSGSIRVLDHSSVLCDSVGDERRLVGRVEDVFGPVVAPFYLVRLMGEFAGGEQAAVKLVVGAELFVLPRFATAVSPEGLDARGSDASNMHDEEVNVKEMDFSDDEEERAARKQMRRRGGGTGAAANSRIGAGPQQHRQQQLISGGGRAGRGRSRRGKVRGRPAGRGSRLRHGGATLAAASTMQPPFGWQGNTGSVTPLTGSMTNPFVLASELSAQAPFHSKPPLTQQATLPWGNASDGSAQYAQNLAPPMGWMGMLPPPSQQQPVFTFPPPRQEVLQVQPLQQEHSFPAQQQQQPGDKYFGLL